MATVIVGFKFTFGHPVAMAQDQFTQRGYVLLTHIFYTASLLQFINCFQIHEIQY